MATAEVKSFDSPDEVRPFEGKGQTKVVQLAGHTIGLGTFEPGWRWSENVGPIAGTDSCQVPHLAYVLSGHMSVRMDDGAEVEIEARRCRRDPTRSPRRGAGGRALRDGRLRRCGGVREARLSVIRLRVAQPRTLQLRVKVEERVRPSAKVIDA